jgi:imidazolonepropionase-like amidohydrolase
MKLIIKGGRIIDGTGAPPITKKVIVVEGNKIQNIIDEEAFSRLPDTECKGEVLDVSQNSILPGLVNCHEHLTMRRNYGGITTHVQKPIPFLTLCAVRSAIFSLSQGITACREMGSRAPINVELKKVIDQGVVLGPRLMTGGEALVMTGGHLEFMFYIVNSVDEVVKGVRHQIHCGADFIKIYTSNEEVVQASDDFLYVPWFPPEAIKAAIEEAHKAGIRVSAHANGTQQIRHCAVFGADSIEHGIMLDRETARIIKEKRIFLVPTLTGYKQNTDPSWRREPFWISKYQKFFEPLWKSFLIALEEGVTVVPGTDTLGDFVEELQLMIKAGMRPMDVLVSATRIGAECMGMADRIGTIEPGKLADLCIVNGDPLEEITSLKRVSLVIKDGVILRPEELRKFFPPSPLYIEGS